MSDVTRQAIVEALLRKMPSSRISRDLGFNYRRVKAVEAEVNQNDPGSPHPKGHWAPPRLRPFVVSVRHEMGPWPEEDADALARAREKYDAGLVEMCQGTIYDPVTGARYVAQYVIPRHTPIKRPPYFNARYP